MLCRVKVIVRLALAATQGLNLKKKGEILSEEKRRKTIFIPTYSSSEPQGVHGSFKLGLSAFSSKKVPRHLSHALNPVALKSQQNEVKTSE